MKKTEELVPIFDKARDAEAEKFKSRQGKLFISSHNPRRTQTVNEERNSDLIAHLKRFAETWWKKNGYKVAWADSADDKFSVEPDL